MEVKEGPQILSEVMWVCRIFFKERIVLPSLQHDLFFIEKAGFMLWAIVTPSGVAFVMDGLCFRTEDDAVSAIPNFQAEIDIIIGYGQVCLIKTANLIKERMRYQQGSPGDGRYLMVEAQSTDIAEVL